MVPTCFLGLFCWLGLFMFHWLWSDQHHPCSATGEWSGLKLFWFIIYKRPGHMTQSGLLIGWGWRGCLAWLPGCMSSLSLMQIRVKVVVFLARSFYWGKLASRPILCNILNLEIWIYIYILIFSIHLDGFWPKNEFDGKPNHSFLDTV